MTKYEDDKYDPLAEGQPTMTVEDADAAIFGEVRAPKSGLVIAKPVAIDKIHADIKQPRRVIPVGVRGEWDGGAASVAELLSKWQQVAAIDTDTIRRLVMGNGDGAAEMNSGDAVVDGLISLCGLAASILKEGLTNPITIVPHGVNYVIETGERRWLAHHLLVKYADDRYKKMVARVVNKFDVYRQASENGSRRPLNAISMARQLAVLVMDMYPQENFESHEFMAPLGQCDRAYYAQVANGATWKIKDGMGQRVQDVTGLKSRKQISDYRSLLSMSDKDWDDADGANWTEGFCRGVMAQSKRTATIQDKKHQEAIEEDAGRELEAEIHQDIKKVAYERKQREMENLAQIAENEGAGLLAAGDNDGGFEIDGVHYDDDLDLIEKTLDSKSVVDGAEDDGEYPDHYDPLSYVKALVEVGDILDDAETLPINDIPGNEEVASSPVIYGYMDARLLLGFLGRMDDQAQKTLQTIIRLDAEVIGQIVADGGLTAFEEMIDNSYAQFQAVLNKLDGQLTACLDEIVDLARAAEDGHDGV